MAIQKHLKKLEDEIDRLIDDYESLGSKITWGQLSYSLYYDYFEIANYQLNSLRSVLNLRKDKKYRDCFILLRTTFEYYLLYILMLRGKKFIQFGQKNSGENSTDALARIQQEIIDYRQRTGDKKIIEARLSSLYDGAIEIIREGPYIDNQKGKGRLYPFYYSVFLDFDPTSAFLDNRDYLNQTWLFPKLNKRLLEDRENQKNLYKYFLTFKSILYAFQLNRLMNDQERKRARAHYAFLSQSVHPSKSGLSFVNPLKHFGSIERLEELNNTDESLDLLILSYCGYLITGFTEELIFLMKNAPKKYIESINSQDIENNIQTFYINHNYFWFIFNEAHDYDKFKYCITRIGRKNYNGFRNIPNEKVPFEKHILNRIRELQSDMSNKICGCFTSPIEKD